MKRLLGLGLVGSIIASSSCYNPSLSQNRHLVLDAPSFTISENKEYAFVTLKDEEKKIYRVQPSIYGMIKSRIEDRDMERLAKPCKMGELLETADVDGDRVISYIDLFAITLSKERLSRLANIVNSHYDYPRVSVSP